MSRGTLVVEYEGIKIENLKQLEQLKFSDETWNITLNHIITNSNKLQVEYKIEILSKSIPKNYTKELIEEMIQEFYPNAKIKIIRVSKWSHQD